MLYGQPAKSYVEFCRSPHTINLNSFIRVITLPRRDLYFTHLVKPDSERFRNRQSFFSPFSRYWQHWPHRRHLSIMQLNSAYRIIRLSELVAVFVVDVVIIRVPDIQDFSRFGVYRNFEPVFKDSFYIRIE